MSRPPMVVAGRLFVLSLAGLLSLGAITWDVKGSSSDIAETLPVELSFRDDFGLSSDLKYVTTLMSNPAAYEGDYGVALAPDELTELRRRLAMEDEIIPLRRYAEAQPSFAGHWIDQAEGGIVYFAFAGDADAHTEAINNLTPGGVTVRVVDAKYTWAELQALQQQIRDDRLDLEKEGIVIRELGPDPEANRVEIGIEAYGAAIAEQLQALYGDAIIVERTGNPTPTVCTDRYHCQGPPLRAGIAAPTNAAVPCSLAFLIRKNGVVGWLTAGHCAQTIGAVWKHNNITIGSIAATCWPTCNYSDAARGASMPANMASYRVFRTTTSNTPVTSVQGFNADAKGHQTCLNGRRQPGITGFRCGVIDEIRDVNYGGVFFLEQRYATFAGYNGDSGGAVHSPYSASPAGVRAYGVESGCEDLGGAPGCEPGEANGRAIYSHIFRVGQELGVTVCNSGSPCP